MRAILTYHSIDASGSPISCHPDAFDRHVRWLASRQVAVVSLETIVGLPDSADAVALTFDDGFVNFSEVAEPRLQAHGMPSTVFVVSDRTGGTNAWRGAPDRGIPVLPVLDWPALARLVERGVSPGAHSRTHRDMTTLSPAEIEDEALGSAAAIERETGVRPTAFAYPYGHVDTRAASVVGRRFRHACTAEFRLLDPGDDLRLLPRLDACYFQQPGRLEAWGTPAFERFVTRRWHLRRARRAALAVARRLRVSLPASQ